MGNRKKSLKPARGFGMSNTIPDEKLLMTQVVTIAALNIASEMLEEHDPSKTKGEWCAWLMQEAAQRLEQAENQEEVNKIMMGD